MIVQEKLWKGINISESKGGQWNLYTPTENTDVIHKKNHPTFPPTPSDDNSLYSFSEKEIEAEQV